MKEPNYKRTRYSCYYAYLAMSSVFVVPPMLFVTFHDMYNISYTLLGTLVLTNFCTQMVIDTIFTFFSNRFNIKLTIRIMPLLTSIGLLCYAILPNIFPDVAYIGLVIGTVIFSVAAGLCEVLISPLVAAIPSDTPEKDMSLLHSLYGWGVVANVLISSIFFALFGTKNWAFLILFLALLPLIATIMFFTSHIPDMNVSKEEKGKKGRGKELLFCALCIFLGSAAENSMTNWISSYMENALNIPKAIGDVLGLAVFALLLAGTRTVYAKYTPDITKTLFVSMLGASVCYIISGLSPNVIVSFITCILIGIFTSMLWPGTLILMEERVPMPGVAAFALMAACGDMGASIAPQLFGIIIDKVSASNFAEKLVLIHSATREEIGLKVGMLVIALFPLAGTLLLIKLMISKKKASS